MQANLTVDETSDGKHTDHAAADAGAPDATAQILLTCKKAHTAVATTEYVSRHLGPGTPQVTFKIVLVLAGGRKII